MVRALLASLLLVSACGDDDDLPADPDATVPAIDGAASAPDGALAADAAGPAWSLPACSMVSGTAAVTFTGDEGATLAPTDGQLTGIRYTWGLVALPAPDRLLAAHAGRILASADAGCTWTDLGAAGAPIVKLVAGPGELAYGFEENGRALVRIDGDTVTPLAWEPASTIVGLGVDPADGERVRLGDSAGQLHESTDGGARFERIGVAAVGPDSLVYRAAFDAADLDHVLFGTAVTGVLRSGDGGDSWDPATGLAETGDRANAFSIEISRVDPDLVWVEGLDLSIADDTMHRRIYRSTDGGRSFTPVVIQSPEVTLINGNLLAAHPSDPDVLYFVFGTWFQGYGTDLYRYHHGDREVTKQHNGHDDIGAIAFSPADPAIMYLGLDEEGAT